MMIYFDNAATSYPKPPCVLQEIIRATREDGGNPGRGGHRLAMRAAQTVYRTREDAAAFFGSSRPENVVFCANATAAIHTAVSRMLRRRPRYTGRKPAARTERRFPTDWQASSTPESS